MAESQPVHDEALLARFVRGDHAALGQLAARHEGALLGLALGLLDGRADLARDAVQDAWVKVIRHGRGFAGRSAVKTWLYRIVINRCIDIRAARQLGALHDAAESQHESAESHAQHAELNGRLRTALATLAGPKRLLLLLCYHQGLTHVEAAEVLGIPVGTLKSRLASALDELRAQLGEEEER